ncbi:DUF5395 domain-containing protein [Nitrosomonas sp.]|uniref:DUF5395 domain-containing protein n=1 Tax=Nitrosomonas sp. TaxID=42353 RepID=UPI0025D7DA5A|nr:DUF5395 domain-containing protein [Nitrosomonas sp.]
MKADLEVRLIHDGNKWVAYHQNFEASGQTLAELDENLTKCLQDGQLFPEHSCVTVFMVFDHNCIPVWIRQYAYHYFNRHILLNLKMPISGAQ